MYADVRTTMHHVPQGTWKTLQYSIEIGNTIKQRWQRRLQVEVVLLLLLLLLLLLTTGQQQKMIW